jgi:hypothetical protein
MYKLGSNFWSKFLQTYYKMPQRLRGLLQRLHFRFPFPLQLDFPTLPEPQPRITINNTLSTTAISGAIFNYTSGDYLDKCPRDCVSYYNVSISGLSPFPFSASARFPDVARTTTTNHHQQHVKHDSNFWDRLFPEFFEYQKFQRRLHIPFD